MLSYLAQVMDAPFIEYLGPAVAIAAIGSSFFGHYLGAAEGAAGIVRSVVTAAGKEPTEKPSVSGWLSLSSFPPG